ncbi:MAG TPA: DNA polymerase IV, partial [Methylibium sp.]
LKLRYDNFKTVTRDYTIGHYTADAQAIRRAAGVCLKRVPLERRLRLLGVRVGALVKASEAPVSTAPAAVMAQEAEAPYTPDLFA